MMKTAFLLTLLATTACASASPLPTTKAPARTPAAGTISQQNCAAAAAYSAERDGVSFLVMQDGKIVCEEYPNGNTADTPHLLASGTKSFTGIMAAVAVKDGFLSLDEKVSDTITEWKSDERKARITIRQLLGLISGIQGGQIGQIPSYAESLNVPLDADPGTHFEYGPVPFQVFGELMRRKLAARHEPADPLDYLTRRILTPLGITPAQWRRGQDGNPNMPSGASLTARNWIPLGEFMRNGGKWNGKQLADAATLAQLGTSGPVNPSYGISWWVEGARGTRPNGDKVTATVDLTENGASLPAGIYLAAGAGIQRLYVIPSERLVVIRQAENLTRAERQQRKRDRRGALMQQGMVESDAREALWSDANFLKLVLGRN